MPDTHSARLKSSLLFSLLIFSSILWLSTLAQDPQPDNNDSQSSSDDSSSSDGGDDRFKDYSTGQNLTLPDNLNGIVPEVESPDTRLNETQVKIINTSIRYKKAILNDLKPDDPNTFRPEDDNYFTDLTTS